MYKVRVCIRNRVNQFASHSLCTAEALTLCASLYGQASLPAAPGSAPESNPGGSSPGWHRNLTFSNRAF